LTQRKTQMFLASDVGLTNGQRRKSVWDRMEFYRKKRQTRKQLEAMSNRDLADIGITRGDIDTIVDGIKE
jgi:uncharacterized protein YjiS (DUF1127 family)